MNHEFTLNFNLVLASDPTGVIGNNNDLPWGHGELTGDLKRFRQLTDGKIVLMGSNTYRSLPTYPKGLPGRLNIVVSSSFSLEHDLNELSVVGNLLHSLDEDVDTNNFVIGDNVIIFQNEWRHAHSQEPLNIHETANVKNLILKIWEWHKASPQSAIVKSKVIDNKVIVEPIEIMVIGGSKLYDSFLYIAQKNELISGSLSNGNALHPYTAIVNRLKNIHFTLTKKLYKGNTSSIMAKSIIRSLIYKDRKFSECNWNISKETHEAMQSHVNFDLEISQSLSSLIQK